MNLNVDALVSTATVTIDGKEHPVHDVTVEEYLQSLSGPKDETDVDMSDEQQVGKVIDELVSECVRYVPSVPEERFRKMTLRQLFGLRNYFVDVLARAFSGGYAPGNPTQKAEKRKQK